MIDKSQTILIGLVILSITSITITMIVITDSTNSLEQIIEPIVEEVETAIQTGLIPVQEPKVYNINQSLQGFSSIKGQGILFNIEYWTVADVSCCEQNSFDAYFSFFDEETGEYVNLPVEDTFVTEDGLLVGTIPLMDSHINIYSSEWKDNFTTVIVEVYEYNGKLKNTLYFPSTPYYLITPEPIAEIEKTFAGFTLDELIELGKLILPLLI